MLVDGIRRVFRGVCGQWPCQLHWLYYYFAHWTANFKTIYYHLSFILIHLLLAVSLSCPNCVWCWAFSALTRIPIVSVTNTHTNGWTLSTRCTHLPFSFSTIFRGISFRSTLTLSPMTECSKAAHHKWIKIYSYTLERNRLIYVSHRHSRNAVRSSPSNGRNGEWERDLPVVALIEVQRMVFIDSYTHALSTNTQNENGKMWFAFTQRMTI